MTIAIKIELQDLFKLKEDLIKYNLQSKHFIHNALEIAYQEAERQQNECEVISSALEEILESPEFCSNPENPDDII